MGIKFIVGLVIIVAFSMTITKIYVHLDDDIIFDFSDQDEEDLM